ncbi:hypothetical protein KGR20_23020 [Cytobacillus oceanisediminis]|uniref:hypothetical protein n=1 Tax=Cytobacillus oceanisediminis TaxID=665099 RepID=UPI001CCFC017|nr:hypothetical protein [Cytobacillus oceanisediminis]MBZ9537034.1 hypothetical protein [Cytobacillus oceanisediminis]
MKLKDHLNADQLRHLEKMGKKKKKRNKQPKEEHVNWVNIMGMDRDRYGRGRGGALKRK